MERKSCLDTARFLRECAGRGHTTEELKLMYQKCTQEKEYWLGLFETTDGKLVAELKNLFEWNRNDMLMELYEMLLINRPNNRPRLFIQCARRFEIMAETF